MLKRNILYNLNFLKSVGYSYHNNINFSKSKMNTINLSNSMNSLNSLVNNCYLCDLSKTRKNVLFGQGNVNASLMIIQEQPNHTEDKMGRFYLEQSGFLLKANINNILNLSTDDIYITNTVKCIDKNNTNSACFNTCSAYLYKQIELVKPKVIVLLGQRVYSYLYGNANSFKQNIGQILSLSGYQTLVTQEQKFLLRNPSSKQEVHQDLLKIKHILEAK